MVEVGDADTDTQRRLSRSTAADAATGVEPTIPRLRAIRLRYFVKLINFLMRFRHFYCPIDPSCFHTSRSPVSLSSATRSAGFRKRLRHPIETKEQIKFRTHTPVRMDTSKSTQEGSTQFVSESTPPERIAHRKLRAWPRRDVNGLPSPTSRPTQLAMPLLDSANGPRLIADHNEKKYGTAWRAWAAAGQPHEGNRQEAVRRMLAWPGQTDVRTLFLTDLQLTSLPPILPDFLNGLSVDDNLLTQLPGDLPLGLRSLSASRNRLTSLPETLPDSIQRLKIQGNPDLIDLPSHMPTQLSNDAKEILAVIVDRNKTFKALDNWAQSDEGTSGTRPEVAARLKVYVDNRLFDRRPESTRRDSSGPNFDGLDRLSVPEFS